MSARSATPTLYATEPSLRLDKGVGFDTALPPFPRAKFAPKRVPRESDYTTPHLALESINILRNSDLKGFIAQYTNGNHTIWRQDL